jgi:hypothetical protein
MELELKPGVRVRSVVCDTELIVVKSPGVPVDLRCGGHPVIAHGDAPSEKPSVEPGFDEGTKIGKRYTGEAGTLELLCTKGGAGSLSIGDVRMELKDAKPLPSSD